MIITGSLKYKRFAKRIAELLQAKFIPRGRKRFSELVEISKYYGEEVGIVYKREGKVCVRIIKYDKENYFTERVICIEEE